MAFKIAPFPGQTYGPRYANHADIAAYFGFGKLVERTMRGTYQDTDYMTIETQKVPVDFSHSGLVVPTTDGRKTTLIYTEGSPSKTGDYRGKSSKHRVMAVCPDCAEMVPAGRTHQHKCKGN